MSNYYSILECSPNASYEELKQHYMQLVLKNHPDKLNNDKDKDVFIRIDEAWKILRDPEKRKIYDACLKQEEFNNQPVVNAVVQFSELSWQEDSQMYQYPCRCGGFYCIEESELESEDYYINCDECSLVIQVVNNKLNNVS